MNWLLLWLFLHILAAVIAIGPIFVFHIVGSLAAQMPQHMRFAATRSTLGPPAPTSR